MSLDLPGFADPVADSQATFRAVLDAMSRPGHIQTIRTPLAPPAPLAPATASVLLTLLDAETTLWLDPAFAVARDWLAFHAGPRVAAEIGTAQFVVTDTLPDLATLDRGSDEEPERSATVILQLAGLGHNGALRLSGPGLRAPATLLADGLPAGFVEQWRANHALFPRGIDLILCAGDRLACLPRSVAVEEG